MRGILIASYGTASREIYDGSIGRIAAELSAAERVLVSECVCGERSLAGCPDLAAEKALSRLAEKGTAAGELEIRPMFFTDGVTWRKFREEIGETAGRILPPGGPAGKTAYKDRPMLSPDAQHKVCVPLLEREDMKDCLPGILNTIWHIGKEPVLLIGHGTGTEADRAYAALEDGFRRIGSPNVRVALLHGSPSPREAMRHFREETGRDAGEEIFSERRIRVIPLLLTAGRHAVSDIAGKEDSVLSGLVQDGFEPETEIRGLCEFRLFREWAGGYGAGRAETPEDRQ